LIKSKHIVIGYLSASMLLFSCNRHRLDIAISKPNATEFNHLQVSNDFNWSSYKTLQINYSPIQQQALHTVIAIKDVKGRILFSRNHNLAEHLNAKILFPIHENRLIIQIGKEEFSKQIDLNNTSLDLRP
jgi:hypothetical protein